MCWYDKTSRHVQVFLADEDCTNESREQVVNEIEHSLKVHS